MHRARRACSAINGDRGFAGARGGNQEIAGLDRRRGGVTDDVRGQAEVNEAHRGHAQDQAGPPFAENEDAAGAVRSRLRVAARPPESIRPRSRSHRDQPGEVAQCCSFL